MDTSAKFSLQTVKTFHTPHIQGQSRTESQAYYQIGIFWLIFKTKAEQVNMKKVNSDI